MFICLYVPRRFCLSISVDNLVDILALELLGFESVSTKEKKEGEGEGEVKGRKKKGGVRRSISRNRRKEGRRGGKKKRGEERGGEREKETLLISRGTLGSLV